MKIAFNRRTILFVAVPATAAALAAGVFFASLKNERERRRVEGIDPRGPASPYMAGREVDAIRRVDPLSGTQPDPMATVREIERINRMNEELRRNQNGLPPKPAPAAPVKPGDRPKQSTTEKP